MDRLTGHVVGRPTTKFTTVIKSTKIVLLKASSKSFVQSSQRREVVRVGIVKKLLDRKLKEEDLQIN